MDVFPLPGVHTGKEVFECVVLCVDRHAGYVVVVPAHIKGLLGKVVAVMLVHHGLKVFGFSCTIFSNCAPQFRGGWFKAMFSLMTFEVLGLTFRVLDVLRTRKPPGRAR